jgi:hypothetical protein
MCSLKKFVRRRSLGTVLAVAAFVALATMGCGGEDESDDDGTPEETGSPECIALVRPTDEADASDAFTELGGAMESDRELLVELQAFVLAPGTEANSVAVWAGGTPVMQMQQPGQPGPDQVASARSALEDWVGATGGRFELEIAPTSQACGE